MRGPSLARPWFACDPTPTPTVSEDAWISCSPGGQDRAVQISNEERKAICRWGYEVLWNTGNYDVIPEAVAPDVVVHDVVNGELHGPDEIREVVAAYRAGFPDVHFTIEDQIAEGDTVVTRYTARGTHLGEFLGISPTGKFAEITGVNISRYSGLLIVEVWETWDARGVVNQLGGAPDLR
jgi:steroid delta-isomerase-like uncharacterized protein